MRALCGLAYKISPSIVFLIETKYDGDRVETVRRCLGFHKAFVVNGEGSHVGLCFNVEE